MHGVNDRVIWLIRKLGLADNKVNWLKKDFPADMDNNSAKKGDKKKKGKEKKKKGDRRSRSSSRTKANKKRSSKKSSSRGKKKKQDTKKRDDSRSSTNSRSSAKVTEGSPKRDASKSSSSSTSEKAKIDKKKKDARKTDASQSSRSSSSSGKGKKSSKKKGSNKKKKGGSKKKKDPTSSEQSEPPVKDKKREEKDKDKHKEKDRVKDRDRSKDKVRDTERDRHKDKDRDKDEQKEKEKEDTVTKHDPKLSEISEAPEKQQKESTGSKAKISLVIRKSGSESQNEDTLAGKLESGIRNQDVEMPDVLEALKVELKSAALAFFSNKNPLAINLSSLEIDFQMSASEERKQGERAETPPESTGEFFAGPVVISISGLDKSGASRIVNDKGNLMLVVDGSSVLKGMGQDTGLLEEVLEKCLTNAYRKVLPKVKTWSSHNSNANAMQNCTQKVSRRTVKTQVNNTQCVLLTEDGPYPVADT
ncbi:hypothetical protein Ciccas_002873 [Cichlidogyrus casuarinus]|uniref:Uncharacterized protein n=1 Tax=Cichlidogyrus casuarinus TaxID=1844966 RepID=A0ABD2QIA3_9PLAT